MNSINTSEAIWRLKKKLHESLTNYLLAVGVGLVFQLFKLLVGENSQPASD